MRHPAVEIQAVAGPQHEAVATVDELEPPLEEKQEPLATTTGTVVSIGPNAWKAFDPGPDWAPWAEVGDRVMYAKYGGKVVKDPDTNEEFVVLNDEDIISRIKETA